MTDQSEQNPDDLIQSLADLMSSTAHIVVEPVYNQFHMTPEQAKIAEALAEVLKEVFPDMRKDILGRMHHPDLGRALIGVCLDRVQSQFVHAPMSFSQEKWTEFSHVMQAVEKHFNLRRQPFSTVSLLRLGV